jgi:hypothetical protein
MKLSIKQSGVLLLLFIFTPPPLPRYISVSLAHTLVRLVCLTIRYIRTILL